MFAEFDDEEDYREASCEDSSVTASGEESDDDFGEVYAERSTSIEETDHEELFCAERIEFVAVEGEKFPRTE